MLMSFSFENALSFKENQSLSLEATNKKKDNFLERNYVSVNDKLNILKSAVIFGANGGGKSNIVANLKNMHRIIMYSLKYTNDEFDHYIPTFLLDEHSKEKNTEYEVEFVSKNKTKYRYGISIKKSIIEEEWLYYTPAVRETNLFYRKNDLITYNRNFTEANKFVKDGVIQKTKKTVPFVSVLASFDGLHSNEVVGFFTSIDFIISDNDDNDLVFTLKLWKDSKEFKEWVSPILKSIGISGIRFQNKSMEEINSIMNRLEREKKNLDVELEHEEKMSEVINKLYDAMTSVHSIVDKEKIEAEIHLPSVEIIRTINGVEYSLPINLESDGTIKLLHLLGKLYSNCINGGVIVIDEFDTKFHTLLSRKLIEMFNELSVSGQFIVTAHDTNLMNTEYLRRDQLWLVNKNKKYESQLYSLVEYKELGYDITNINYSDEYLRGVFDAIPLFDHDVFDGGDIDG